MPPIESTSIHRPTRYAVTVVDLLQGNARGHHYLFHLSSVLNRSVRIGIQRFDKNAPAPACQSRKHESPRIINAQQSSLDADTPG